MGDNHTVYKNPEGMTTQWEDIQRKRGNMAPAEPVWKPDAWAPAPDAPRGAALLDGDAEAVEDLEGEFDDDRFLEDYRCVSVCLWEGRRRENEDQSVVPGARTSPSIHLLNSNSELPSTSQKRLAELRAAADAVPHPGASHLPTVTRAEYVERVTRASTTRPVLAVLVREGGAAGGPCSDAVAALASLAASPAGVGISAVRVEADEAASGPGRLPDAALPTLLVYQGGSAVAKLTGPAALGAAGGGRITPDSLLDAVRRAAPGVVGDGRTKGGRGGGRSSSDEEDSD